MQTVRCYILSKRTKLCTLIRNHMFFKALWYTWANDPIQDTTLRWHDMKLTTARGGSTTMRAVSLRRQTRFAPPLSTLGGADMCK